MSAIALPPTSKPRIDEVPHLDDIDAALDPILAPFGPTSNAADDQATRLRNIVSPPAAPDPPLPRSAPVPRSVTVPPKPRNPLPRPRVAKLITIASGKGGVGKTTLAVNLAIALSQRGLRVTLLDADLGTANADLLCGLSPKGRLEHVFAPDEASGGRWADGAPRSLRDITVQAPGGFRLVPGAAGVSRMADLTDTQRRALVAALSEIGRDSDIVLIDASAGVGRDVTAMMDAADLTLVVATPEPTSIADAYALIKCASSAREDAPWADLTGSGAPTVALLMNQVSGEAEARAVHARIAAVAERFLAVKCPLAGWIAHDLRVPEAVRARVPFLLRSPASPAAVHVITLAARLIHRLHLQTPSPATSASPKGGISTLVRRLLGLSPPAGTGRPAV